MQAWATPASVAYWYDPVLAGMGGVNEGHAAIKAQAYCQTYSKNARLSSSPRYNRGVMEVIFECVGEYVPPTAPLAKAPASPPDGDGKAQWATAEPMPSPSVPTSKPGRRVALVIGNGAYAGSPLKNPVNDAQDVANMLKRLGFEVIMRQDADLKTMELAVETFYDSLKKGGAGLFYFAGHGVQVAGSNYLVPVKARIRSESDVKFEAVDASRVLGKMEDAGNGLNLVILDACRNNPYSRGFRSSAQGLAKMDAPTGSLIAYATAPGSVASDGGPGRNGVYTKHLLMQLGVPGLTAHEMFMRVRLGVVEETGSKQVPWESSSLTGYFYFVGQR